MAEETSPSFSPVLITGGNGFLAYHIISKLLEAEPDCRIHSLDIDTSRNRRPGVQYHECDIADAAAVQRVVEEVRPITVFHAVTPETSDHVPQSAFYNVVTGGTKNLLQALRTTGCARALVNSSSSSVVHDNVSDLIDAREDLPVLHAPVQWRAFSLAKAEAEEAVAAANRAGAANNGRETHRHGGLLTASMRPALVFGERDVGALGKMFAEARKGRARYQMGAGDNLFDFVYAENAADAHLLLARALLDAWGRPPPAASARGSAPRVDGECFHVTNDDPWRFWDFQRAVSAAAGLPVRPEEVVVIPRAVGMLIAYVSEWWTWAVSWGRRAPNVTTEGIRFSTMTRTLNMDKAKTVLGYRPKVSMQEGIERGVAYFLAAEKQAKEDLKAK